MITELCRWGASANPYAVICRMPHPTRPSRPYLGAVCGPCNVVTSADTFSTLRLAFEWVETQLTFEDQTS